MVKQILSPSNSSGESGSENDQTDFSDEEFYNNPSNRLLLKSIGKFASWDAVKMRSCRAPRSNMKIYVVTNNVGKLNSNIVLVTPAMMGYCFPLPLNQDMAKLCKFYDSSLMQLSPQVVLVYKGAKLLEKAFGVTFGFEEIVHLQSVLETTRKGKRSKMVQKIVDHSWVFTNRLHSYKYWLDFPHIVKGAWNELEFQCITPGDLKPPILKPNALATSRLRFYFDKVGAWIDFRQPKNVTEQVGVAYWAAVDNGAFRVRIPIPCPPKHNVPEIAAPLRFVGFSEPQINYILSSHCLRNPELLPLFAAIEDFMKAQLQEKNAYLQIEVDCLCAQLAAVASEHDTPRQGLVGI